MSATDSSWQRLRVLFIVLTAFTFLLMLTGIATGPTWAVVINGVLFGASAALIWPVTMMIKIRRELDALDKSIRETQDQLALAFLSEQSPSLVQ